PIVHNIAPPLHHWSLHLSLTIPQGQPTLSRRAEWAGRLGITTEGASHAALTGSVPLAWASPGTWRLPRDAICTRKETQQCGNPTDIRSAWPMRVPVSAGRSRQEDS